MNAISSVPAASGLPSLSFLALAGDVLARPAALIEAHAEAPSAGRLVPGLLGLVVAGGGLYGLAVGTFEGGAQVALAAAKMPLVLLAPLLVAVPALRVLSPEEEGEVSFRRAAFATLVGTARVAVLAAALVPLVWLLFSLDPPYALANLAMAAGLALVGLPGLATVGRALSPGGRSGRGSRILSVLLVGFVIGQTGWLLRPFVVTPGAPVSVLCAVEHDVVTGLASRVLLGGPTLAGDGVSGVAEDCDPILPLEAP